MITKPILVTLVTSLLFCSGCAAKNRWFSRRDYAEMQDPFMQPEAVASAEGSRKRPADATGRARLGGGLTADTGSLPKQPGSARISGPKPIQQAVVREKSTTHSGRIANASYPQDTAASENDSARTKPDASHAPVRSYQGSALSEFLNRKKADASPPSATLPGGPNDPSASLAAATAKSPAAQAAAVPKLSGEAAGFGNFLQQESSSLNAVAQQATQTIQESEDSVTDFSTWAEQQKSDWSRGGAQAVSDTQSAAKNELHAAGQQTRRMADDAGQQARRMADDAVFDFNKPDFDTAETAELLIRPSDKRLSPQKPRPDSTLAFEEPTKPAPMVEENPPENPFDFAEIEPVAAKLQSPATPNSTAKSAMPRKALDASFQIDNGWKPAHMTRP